VKQRKRRTSSRSHVECTVCSLYLFGFPHTSGSLSSFFLIPPPLLFSLFPLFPLSSPKNDTRIHTCMQPQTHMHTQQHTSNHLPFLFSSPFPFCFFVLFSPSGTHSYAKGKATTNKIQTTSEIQKDSSQTFTQIRHANIFFAFLPFVFRIIYVLPLQHYVCIRCPNAYILPIYVCLPPLPSPPNCVPCILIIKGVPLVFG
jgi:hypothetical protein